MSEKRKHTITVNYGNDIHSIDVTPEELEAIRSGKLLRIDGQGFVHEVDGAVQDYWVFNEEPGEAYFYLENGAQFYGDILEGEA